MVGQTVLKKYKIGRLLDEGGMSKIYLARQTSPDREVVVKALKDEMLGHVRAQEHFKREIHIMSRFQHPHAVAYIDSSTRERNGPVLVMEYLRGLDLGLLLKKQGKLHVDRVGRLLAQLCEVLRSAHDAGIVHRDLKPGNLMILHAGMPQETLKLMDFGLARMASMLYLSAEEIVDWRLPSAAGTPEYICPEQIRGVEVDRRGDIYCVGVVLYEMLGGRLPFQRANLDELLAAHLEAPPPPLGLLGGPTIPPAIADVVHSCLAKAPEQRPQDATELIQRFEQALGKNLRQVASAPSATPAPRVLARPSPAPRAAAHANAFTHCVEATMPESMAMVKVKGFIFDLGGEIVDTVPGTIRVRVPAPRGEVKARGGLFGWMDRGNAATLDAPAATDLELHLERRDPGQSSRLTITLVMRPTKGMMTVEWRDRCQAIGRDLGAYLMGR